MVHTRFVISCIAFGRNRDDNAATGLYFFDVSEHFVIDAVFPASTTTGMFSSIRAVGPCFIACRIAFCMDVEISLSFSASSATGKLHFTEVEKIEALKKRFAISTGWRTFVGDGEASLGENRDVRKIAICSFRSLFRERTLDASQRKLRMYRAVTGP